MPLKSSTLVSVEYCILFCAVFSYLKFNLIPQVDKNTCTFINVLNFKKNLEKVFKKQWKPCVNLWKVKTMLSTDKSISIMSEKRNSRLSQWIIKIL